MNFSNTVPTDALDIIFLNRNKSYGAYPLRKHYHKRLSAALAVMVGFCLMASLLFKWQTAHYASATPVIVGPEIILDKANTKEPVSVQPPPVKPVHIKPIRVATIKVTTPVIVKDNEVTTPPPTNNEIEGVKISLTTAAGVSGDMVAPPVETTGAGAIKDLIAADDYTREFHTVQQQARFPGGADAWKHYLERNLRQNTPTDNGAVIGRYTVEVSFLVDKEGNISEVKAENNPGYGTAAEAIRVIEHGPKWQPAMQNGRVVLFRQKQNITFIVAEEN